MATAARSRPRAPIAVRKTAPRTTRARPRRSSRLALWVMAAAVVLLALLYVWLRLQVVQMGYALSTTAKLQSQLERVNRELRVELASLTSPERLEEAARRRLGLAPPQKGQVIVLP